jgi:tRNA modification GTPase
MDPQRQRTRDKSGYLSEDTIAALATGPGGAINVVRVSGPEALEAVKKLSSIQEIRTGEERKLQRCTVYDEAGKKIDEALLVFFIQPESFTGEDCVELHLHGGSFIASCLMESLSRLGIRQALPGEFSFRAVRNGKMTLLQASAVADLVKSKNREAVTLALEKMEFHQARFLIEIVEELKGVVTLSAAGIDFMDQDIEELSVKKLQERVRGVLEKLKKTEESFQRGSRIQEGLSAVFVGLPNAGKSSIFNALLGQDRSIVSDQPGTTRDIIREHLTLMGAEGQSVTLNIQDTAGLRSSLNKVEKTGMERTLKAAEEADLVLVVVDASSPVAQIYQELEKLDQTKRDPKKTIGILSKCDLIDDERACFVKNELASVPVSFWLNTSAKSGEGVGEAATQIASFCSKWLFRNPSEFLLTRVDQRQAIREALEHLRRGMKTQACDLFAADLMQALHALAPIVGETPTEEILGRIFSQFCIGK